MTFDPAVENDPELSTFDARQAFIQSQQTDKLDDGDHGDMAESTFTEFLEGLVRAALFKFEQTTDMSFMEKMQHMLKCMHHVAEQKKPSSPHKTKGKRTSNQLSPFDTPAGKSTIDPFASGDSFSFFDNEGEDVLVKSSLTPLWTRVHR